MSCRIRSQIDGWPTGVTEAPGKSLYANTRSRPDGCAEEFSQISKGWTGCQDVVVV